MKLTELKKHYIMILAIMFVVVSLSDTTYSLFFKAESTDEFTYTIGNLDLQFTEDEQITLQNAFPIIDSEGLETKPYTLSIKNIGTLPYLFDLKMLSSTEENIIDSKYIKYQVNDGKPSTLYATNNTIASNVIIYPNEEKKFNIKIWLDNSTPNNQLGKTFIAKITTSGEAIYKTLDTSGANHPNLVSGMIPVYYDEETSSWKKADSSNLVENYEWYNYDNKKWANAITIKNSNKEIYEITGEHNIQIDSTRTNNGNYVSDENYLDLKINNYNYNNISNIFRIKFNDLTTDKINIITNGILSYYYDNINKQFTLKIGDNIVNSDTYELENNTWYILGYTYNQEQVSFYINGNNISNKNITGSIYSNNTFKIATDETFKELSNMEVGDIYIYNSILTDKEITENYNQTINIIYDNLYAGFNDFEPKTITDYYLSQDLGFTINERDIQEFYVWIPRFKYKLWNVTGSEGIDSYDAYNKGIDIVFENQTNTSGTIRCENNICYNDDLMITRVSKNDNGKYYTHPAFSKEDEEVIGLWVSKYEISTSSQECNDINTYGCLTTNLSIESKKGNTVWRNNYLSNFYQAVKQKENDKYHIIKNTEWGAISYLTHSKYGLCENSICNSLGVNQTYISGNKSNDSTTLNIYGVYDLAGSATEFVMSGLSNNSNTLDLRNKLELPEYDYEIYQENNFILGDATKELSLNGISWYNQQSTFINETNNIFIRGGIGTTTNNGIFYYNATTDNNSNYITTRIVIK